MQGSIFDGRSNLTEEQGGEAYALFLEQSVMMDCFFHAGAKQGDPFAQDGEAGFVSTRIGFVGIVIEDMRQSTRVNEIVGLYNSMVTGRIGVPDHTRGIAVIGLLVEGSNDRIGAFTGTLGNIPGVSVKSALTAKEWPEAEKEEKQ